MTKQAFKIEENVFLQYTLIILGIILSAVGINLYLAPAKMLSGGLSGICIMLNKLFGINQGFTSFVLNIPIFVVAAKYLDRKFLLISFINMFLFSIVLGATQDIYKYFQLDDIMLQCVYGGLLNGIGMGLVFKSRSSAGGLDLIAAMLKVKFDIPMKNTFMSINFFIVLAGGFLFGSKLVMYTLISMYITSISMELAKDCFDKKKSILLISDKYEQISKTIMSKMGRGITFIEAEGAYTNNKKKIIYCIVSSSEVCRFKELVYQIDNQAFISVNNVEEVRGGGFREKFL